MDVREDIRNIAIIAHVDHGKTTLVDRLLSQSGIFRQNETVADRVMDSNDLERERGITILSKNTGIYYNNVKINIVDTPGHADFGGEVERIMMMVDGALLLVDAFEGCMPQTRFVLKKALALGKKVIVVINKIDRPGSRPAQVIDEVLDLFIELGASDDQLEFPVVYASAKDGYSSLSSDEREGDMRPLLDSVLESIEPPRGEIDAPFQLLFSSLDYDDYIGRIGIGKVERGRVTKGQIVTLCKTDGTFKTARIVKLYQFEGLRRIETNSAKMGDLIAVSGISDLNIGETVCDPEHPQALSFVKIDEPTISMNFMVNDSPFAGKEGAYVTSRNIRSRLLKEVEANVSMRVEQTDTTDSFKVSGRGELHLSILIETMRRQGYEFQVSRPKVIFKKGSNGELLEPMELLIIEVPGNYVGAVMEKIGLRKGELENMDVRDGGSTHLEFNIPARGLIGYRSEFVAHETGESTAYGLFGAQERGRLFIGPGASVYEGMIVGECAKNEDIVCNVCKKKQMTNTRASGSDEALRLVPHSVLSLEQSMEFIGDDELVEITPLSIRLRKRILSKEMRMKQQYKKG
ncbi:MAG: GTP-binding protein TypA/BipA [Firmicutes bacterium ADurb.Bin300]|nr:MAG: GTP-binding protein TypA/BipA [Firmicutes bacterium ADurb.Bin300]